MKYLCMMLPLLLVSCVSPSNTKTGKAEVTISAPRDRVKTALVSGMVDLDYTATNDSSYSMTFEKEGSATDSMLMGSQYDRRVVIRVRYTLVERTGGTRVVTDIHGVTIPGSAYERTTNMSTSSDSAHQAQAFLERAKASVEGRAPRAP